MKRLAAAVLLLAGSVALLLAPFWTCPDCLGLEVRLDPAGIAGGPSPVGCPRCDDAGKVPALNRWVRRGLDPDVATLVRDPWSGSYDFPSGFEAALGRLLARSGLDLKPLGYGSAVFLDDGGERLPMAVCSDSFVPDRPARAAVFLFSPGGGLLDHLEVRYPGKLEIPAVAWMPAGSKKDHLGIYGSTSKRALDVLHRGSLTSMGPPLRVTASHGKLVVAGEAPK